MTMRNLYLVRHGAVIADNRRRFLGQMDVPLNQEGFGQAEALQDRLKAAIFNRIYCSDLSRSRDTAMIIAGDRHVTVIPRHDLREISLGFWEGCAMDNIATRYPKAFRAHGEGIEHYRPPGGENFADCRTRTLSAVEEILAHSEGDVVIVGHAGVNRVILCEALAIPLANLFKIGQDFGCLNVLESNSSGFRVKLLNFTPQNALIEAAEYSDRLEAISAH